MNSSDLMELKQSASGQMYQNLHQGHSSISRPTFPADGRSLMLQGRSIPEESKIVLSTEAKPRLKWTKMLHYLFVEAVNQLGGADKATPTAVMKLMALPGLTLYHLKSHLQKYRLGKTLQGQANRGSTKSGCKVEAERRTERSVPVVGIPDIKRHTSKNVHTNGALKVHIEVQRRLQEQLEVRRHLQQQIETQGKFLQCVLEKAKETIGNQNLGCSGLYVKLSEHVTNSSSKCCSSAFAGQEVTNGRNALHPHQCQLADCSVDASCLTSSEASQKDQEIINAHGSLRTYNGNFRDGEGMFLEHSHSNWAEDEHGTGKQSNSFRLGWDTTELDLNANNDNESGAQSNFDLNSFA